MCEELKKIHYTSETLDSVNFKLKLIFFLKDHMVKLQTPLLTDAYITMLDETIRENLEIFPFNFCV